MSVQGTVQKAEAIDLALPADFLKLQAAEQQVLQALELAASVVHELSLLSSADPQKAEAQTSQFLETAKDLQAVLLLAIQTHATTKPYQNSAYLAGLKADAAAQRVTAARAELVALEQQLAAKRSRIVLNRGGERNQPHLAAAVVTSEESVDMEMGL